MENYQTFHDLIYIGKRSALVLLMVNARYIAIAPCDEKNGWRCVAKLRLPAVPVTPSVVLMIQIGEAIGGIVSHTPTQAAILGLTMGVITDIVAPTPGRVGVPG